MILALWVRTFWRTASLLRAFVPQDGGLDRHLGPGIIGPLLAVWCTQAAGAKTALEPTLLAGSRGVLQGLHACGGDELREREFVVAYRHVHPAAQPTHLIL